MTMEIEPVTHSPERVWLEDPAATETEHGRTWCDHNAWEGEPDCQPVEYVRADLCRPAVRVKPLEWVGRGTWSNQPCYHADSAFGWLMIVDHTTHGNGFRVYPPWEEPAHSETYPSLEAAKAAAHADYEARVLAAIEGGDQ